MNYILRKWQVRLLPLRLGYVLLACILLTTACRKLIIHDHNNNNNNNNEDLAGFTQVNLVANNMGYDPKLVDSTLQNAWGLAWSPNGIAWVNSQAGHVSALYTAEGAIVRAPVKIPSPGDTIGGNPTGIVFNSTKGFKLTNGTAASFIFVGVDGIVSAWNGAAGARAETIADRSAHSAYTGLALASFGGTSFIYAANFRAGRIDVWDTAWSEMHFSFRDHSIPSGYAPFNIQAVGSWLYVTYAQVGPDGRSAAGAGKGFVDIFNTDGSFVDRFASGGSLNAPWGVTMAPAGFLHRSDIDSTQTTDDHGGNRGGGDNRGPGGGGGNGGGDDNRGPGNGGNNGGDTATMGPVILIGNFGDGRINVFSPEGKYLGQLMTQHKVIVISGLWAIRFAPTTATAIDPMRLYFTAGPAKETDGLFGYLIKE
ncbi:TIGR03118 family protein [Puia sp.]|jgi:uncharacterized protein (TIGR03118 family)|uniref:TIGR03118 family protein n=1 Tax=Puia sp. TaxID=2045100 RepID=UPI002F42E62E